jgi:polar amino acid transport system permease protein
MNVVLDFSAILNERYLPYFLTGIRNTAILFVLTWIVALPLAVLLTLARSGGIRPLSWLVALYVEYHRNVPLLVQLLFWYFGISTLFPDPVNDFVNRHNTEFIFSLVALVLYTAAYMSEDMRSGLRAIPKTQFEAARAIGFGFFETMAYVIIPQVWRLSLPPLVNQTLILFKGTSLAASIGVAELTFQARQVESISFRVFESFFVVSVIYLSGSLMLMFGGAWLAQRYKLRTR